MNQLVAIYKTGHKRVVNLDKSFFSDNTPVFNSQTKKLRVMSVDTKAVDLAHYLDKEPYIVEMIRDGITTIQHTYNQNKPEDYGNNKRTGNSWN